MEGVRPCPYCGGEVEVVKLDKKKGEKQNPYRIECRKCRALVVRGYGFPIESSIEQEQRIRDYEDYINRKFDPRSSTRIKIGGMNKLLDHKATYASRMSYDDEEFETHDIADDGGRKK